jgi:hypothetical protein
MTSNGSVTGAGSDGLGSARMALALKQSALVAALVADGAVPSGFNPEHVSAVRRGLTRKRLGGVAHHFPGLAAGVRADPGLMELFRDWHFKNPREAGEQSDGGSLADGVRLMGFLDAAGRLPAAATRELLLLRMETDSGPGGSRTAARWWGFRKVTVGGRAWLAAGTHRRYRWVLTPR